MTEKSGLPLTDRERDIFDFVANYITVNGYAPKIREVAAEFDVSHQAANSFLIKIEAKGFVRRVKRKGMTRRIVLANA